MYDFVTFHSFGYPTLPSRNVDRNYSANMEPMLEAIRLPNSLGLIYASQLFSSYLIVSNVTEKEQHVKSAGLDDPLLALATPSSTSTSSNDVAINARFNVKIKNPSGTEHVLVDNRSEYIKRDETDTKQKSSQNLRPEDYMDMVVSHRLRVAGEYVMSVTVRYDDLRYPEGHRSRAFKKVFSFKAVDALKTIGLNRFRVPQPRNETLIQVAFRNMLKEEICVENVSVRRTSDGSVRSDVEIVTDGAVTSPPSSTTCVNLVELSRSQLAPETTRCTLVRMRTRDENGQVDDDVGSIWLHWRSRGSVEGEYVIPISKDTFLDNSTRDTMSSSSKRTLPKADGGKGIDVSIDTLPDDLCVDVPSQVVVRVTNRSKQNRDLRLVLRPRYAVGLTFAGLTTVNIGSLGPSQSKSLKVSVLPQASGLLKIAERSISVLEPRTGLEVGLRRARKVLVRFRREDQRE